VPSRFQKISRGGWTAYAVAEFPRDLLIRLAECPDLPLRTGPAETIKAGNTSLVVRASLPMHAGMTSVAYKLIRRKTVLKKLTQAITRNRTLRTFLMGHRFLQHGIATARPLAVIVPSRFDVASPSWLATEWVEGETVASFAERVAQLTPSARKTAADTAAIALGTLLGKMHAAGITHRDLKSHNLMLRRGIDGEIRAAVIDLDGAAFAGRAVSLRRWKDVARLTADAESWPVSHATRMRFLNAYLRDAGLRDEPKSAWRRVRGYVTTRQRRRAA
jgi:tRNA A-37 threonylcarbamoyl transferase component Bud32